jgi:ribosomal protein S18 acetylase RimI-like enzyme
MEIRLLAKGDEAVLSCVADGVFDYPIRPGPAAEYLADPRLHLCVAIEDGQVVGMASGVHYHHPDKDLELFVNEVGVAPTHQRRGIAKAVLGGLLRHARTIGCTEAWVLTDHDNAAGRALYGSLGGSDKEAGLMFSFRLEGG